MRITKTFWLSDQPSPSQHTTSIEVEFDEAASSVAPGSGTGLPPLQEAAFRRFFRRFFKEYRRSAISGGDDDDGRDDNSGPANA